MIRRARSQGGFALLAVLWFMMLLALIAASMSRTTRTSLQLAHNVVEAAKAEALADAGVWHGVLEVLEAGPPPPALDEQLAARLADRPNLRQVLLDRPEIQAGVLLRRLQGLYGEDDGMRPWPRDGSMHEWPIAGQSVRIAIQDEAGKIDLNTGPPEVLGRLLEAAGLNAAQAAALTEGLDSGGANGPEGPMRSGGGNETWYTVAELLALPGMSRELYARVAPVLTVHSGLYGIDPAVAPRQVLLAVPGLQPATIDALLAARTDPLALDGTELAGLEGYVAVPEREIVTIRAEAETEGGAAFVREAVVEVRRDARPPFVVLDWRRGDLR